MEVFNVLDPNIVLDTHRLIEASAGTGKTFAIEHLVSRFIIEKEISIENLAVVTFTRKATRQMKNRIRECLLKCLIALEKQDFQEIPYLASCEPQEAIKNLKTALAGFEGASIQTLHAFCMQLLIQHIPGISPFKNFDFENLDLRKFLEPIICDFVCSELAQKLLSLDQWMALMQFQWKWEYETLLQTLIKVLCSPVDIEVIEIGFKDTLTELTKILSSQTTLQHLEQLCLAYESSFKAVYLPQKRKAPDSQKTIKKFFEILTQGSETGTDYILWMIEKFNTANLKVKSQSKVPQELKIFDEAQQFVSSFKAIRKGSLAFTKLARLCQITLGPILDERSVVIPDKILTQVDRNLDQLAFRKAVQDQFAVIIVDEFQDTDPMQWSILEKLMGNEQGGPKIICVGDPKQSIYAFRRADIYTYIQAKQKLSSSGRLITNYRSSYSLIQALNDALGSENLPGWMDLPRMSQKIEVYPLLANPKLESKEENSLIFVNCDENETLLWDYLSAEILSSQVPLKQWALLVSDHLQATTVQEKFKSFGICSVLQKNKLLAGHEIVGHLKIILQVVLQPKHPSSLKKLLLCPLIGYCLDELCVLWPLQNETLEFRSQLQNQIDQLNYLLTQKGFATFWKSFLDMRWHYRKNLKLSVEIYQRLSLEDIENWNQLVTWLIQYDHQETVLPFDLIQKLDDLEQMRVEEGPEELSNQEDAVNILTMHSSKGLEFEHVIVYGASKRRRPSDEAYRQTPSGWQYVLCELLGPEELNAAYDEQDAEKARLLYVSLTRAKSRVYVTIPSIKKKIERGYASPLELYMARFGYPETSDYEQIYQRIAHKAFDPFKNFVQKHPCMRWVETCDYLPKTISSPVHKIVDHVPQETTLVQVEYPQFSVNSFTSSRKHYTLPSGSPVVKKVGEELAGTSLGQKVHDLIDWVCKKRHQIHENIFDLLLQEITRRYPRLKQQDHELIFELVKKGLMLPLPFTSKRKNILEIEPENIFTEVAFLYPDSEYLKDYQGFYWNGSIDVMVRVDDELFVIDWKTNKIEEDQDLKLYIESRGYWDQALIYEKACKRYLNATGSNLKWAGFIFAFLRLDKTYMFGGS